MGFGFSLGKKLGAHSLACCSYPSSSFLLVTKANALPRFEFAPYLQGTRAMVGDITTSNAFSFLSVI